MLHVITLFTVPDGEKAFVDSLRMNGDWQTLARRIAPDLIGTDLLRHQLSPLYLCHDFWTSPIAYFHAARSPAVQHLLLARRVMAESAFELGAFSFPASAESSKSFGPVST